jgi:thioredoxin reductase (NADPH)
MNASVVPCEDKGFIRTSNDNRDMETDVLIIGSGTAGVQAAIYAARKGLQITVLGKTEPGFREKSAELLKNRKAQAEDHGTSFYDEDILMIKKENDGFLVKTEEGKEITSKALILAVDIHKKKLDVKGEERFHGKGVSYCAECDCAFFKNKDVVVVGNEVGAVSSALLLRKYASRVYLVTSELRVGKRLKEELNESDIEVYEGGIVKEIYGNEMVEGIVLDNGVNITAQGIFIEIGAKGSIELAIPLGVSVDADGHIPVNEDMETNVKGVYACGDITGPPLRFAKAVRQGCIAGTKVAEYVKGKK